MRMTSSEPREHTHRAPRYIPDVRQLWCFHKGNYVGVYMAHIANSLVRECMKQSHSHGCVRIDIRVVV